MIKHAGIPFASVAVAALVIMIDMKSVMAQAPVPVVEVAITEERDLAPELWVPGTVTARYDALISAEVDGRLNWVAEIGDHVKKGDALATIDDSRLQLNLRNNEAQVKRIQSDLAYQKRQIARLDTLSAQNNTAKSGLDAAEARRDMLTQDLVAARVALENTQLDIAKARVSAPYDGVIAERRMNQGEYTRNGQELLRLVNTDLLEVSARAPISVIRHSSAGDAVRVSSDHTESTHALRTLVPVGDARSRMIEVRVDLESSDWVIGEAVRVALSNGNRINATAVPRDALVLRDDGVSVFVVGEDSVAHRVRVITGTGSGHYIGVAGDLDSDARVVVRGAENLRDGQEVKIITNEIAALVQ
jgi:RND family efflux transporter MFP subunit